MEKIDSKESLIRIINQYQNLVFSICLKMTGDYFTAEDITQETFLAVFNHWQDFDGTNEKTWICRIASNKCIDYLKAAARKDTFIGDDEVIENISDSAEPEREVINKDIMDGFADAIDRLDEPYSSVAKEHFISGKNAKEISVNTGVSLKTVQTQIYRARSMLKQIIRKEDLTT